MTNFLRIPKIQLSITLFLILLTAIFTNFSTQNIVFVLVSVVSCALFDLLFLTIRKKPLFFPSAALVTGLIIGLVGNPNLVFFQTVIICFFAIVSKNFIRPTGRHIFNPAAFGLIIGSFLFGNSVSWWGVSWQQLKMYDVKFIMYYLILLLPGFISLIRMRRFRITLVFLVVYYILQIILNTKYLLLTTIFDPTVLFFSFVMLPEPMTSPNNHTRQLLFGLSVGVVSLIVSLGIINWRFDPLLLSLLIGNLIFFRLK